MESAKKRAEEIFAWGLAERQRLQGDAEPVGDDAQSRSDADIDLWVMHSRSAAKVAEKIAIACGMDVELAYAMGLLHDLGRYMGPGTGMKHIVYGYDKLMEEGWPEVARICLTHSFNPPEKVEWIRLEDEADQQRVREFVLGVEYDDYDRLIQLADFMAGSHGATTIERRFCSVLRRHNMVRPREVLNKIYELKAYFDQKAGQNIYELLREDLIDSIFRETPGDYYKKEEA